jgi:hypothetical protein
MLGNGNLGQAILMMRRRERGEQWGRAGRWIGNKTGAEMGEVGERGAMGRGKEGPEITQRRGNKGRKIDKKGGGRVEERGEPSMAGSVRTGHLEQTMRYGQ